MRVIVVGAGVTGLTVGVRLVEAGYEVHLLARELPLETTSAVAAALWYPYRAHPVERVLAWSQRSLEELTALAGGNEDCGVVMRAGVELVRERTDIPSWAQVVPDFTRLHSPPPPYDDGWTFAAPVIEMPLYLTWLQQRLEASGGTVTRMALSALPDHADVVVNCSGLGARLLGSDGDVVPVRGQVVRLAQVGVEKWLLDGSGLTYVVPRSRDIIVGGTDSEGEWDRRPDPDAADQILARAVALVPVLADAPVLGHRVGLRPARPTVRLEREASSASQTLIHCYGHGGAGVTLSWGCADEVLSLVEPG
jgi:D-amino-acid oxidase